MLSISKSAKGSSLAGMLGGGNVANDVASCPVWGLAGSNENGDGNKMLSLRMGYIDRNPWARSTGRSISRLTLPPLRVEEPYPESDDEAAMMLMLLLLLW